MQSHGMDGRRNRSEPSILPKPKSIQKVKKGNDKEGSTKRPRVAQACEECRARKVRCDGGHPGMLAYGNTQGFYHQLLLTVLQCVALASDEIERSRSVSTTWIGQILESPRSMLPSVPQSRRPR